MKRRIVLVSLTPSLVALAVLWSCDGGVFPLGNADRGVDATDATDDRADDASASDARATEDSAASGYVCPSLDGGTLDAFAPSNFDPSALDASVIGDIDVSDVDGGCTFDTDALTFTCAHQSFAYSALSVDQDGGPPLAIFATGAFTIEPGVVVDAFGVRPLVIYAQGPVDIGGELRASGRILTAGSRFQYASGSLLGKYVPAGPGSSASGSGFCGASGSGSDAGQRTYGTATLTPLLGGSGYDLAAGGGAIQVSSTTAITLRASGTIQTNGWAGEPEMVTMDFFVGIGGASGGAILLEAPTATLAGGLAANGGGGAIRSTSSSCIACSGGTSPGVAQAPGCSIVDGGGAGSVGDDPNGQVGIACAGGGGAGWITVKTHACGSKGGVIGGVVSPSFKSGCATVLPLALP